MAQREPLIDRVIKCLEIARQYGPNVDTTDGLVYFDGPVLRTPKNAGEDVDATELLRLGAFFVHDHDSWAIFT